MKWKIKEKDFVLAKTFPSLVNQMFSKCYPFDSSFLIFSNTLQTPHKIEEGELK